MRFRPRPASAWIVSAALLATTVLVTWPLARRLGSSFPGDYGDPVFVAWVIGWVGGKLSEAITNPVAIASLWDANIFYPERTTLAFSEHFIGQTTMVLPVYWLTGNLMLAYNIAFLASFVLTGLGTFLLTRALTGSVFGALLAAAVASFNEYRLVYEVAHLHVLSIYWLPFALLGLHRYFETDARRYLLYAAAALIALNYSSVYYVAYCAPFVALFALVEMVHWRRVTALRVWLELWAAAALVVVATLPVLLPYSEVQRRLGIERPIEVVVRYSATLVHYRTALPGMLPALIVAAVAVLGLAIVRSVRLRWAVSLSLVLLFLSFWLSLGPIPNGGGATGWPGLYALFYDYVPGYRGLRVPSRFAALFFIFLGLLAGAGIAVLEARWRIAARAAAVGTLVVFVALASPRAMPLDRPLPSEGLASPPSYLTPAAELPPLYRTVSSLRYDAVLVEFPFGDPWYDLRYMYFAALHRRRLLNGYSGIFPPSFLARRRVLTQPTLDPARAAAAVAGATHAIVHRRAWTDETGRRIGAWLESFGARLIAELDGATVYELPVRETLADVAVQKEGPPE